MTDVYNDTLRLTLQRDLSAFEKAGMQEEAGKVKARLRELDKPQPAEEPVPKASGKSKAATKEG